ncbi:MAG: phospholipid carrier-dependent glycosyltransferase [Propionibacteriaceae bacterium]|nr:phospholipid carrier-dependent glycosyltransferase [Propionibacteriaceae bacterium]
MSRLRDDWPLRLDEPLSWVFTLVICAAALALRLHGLGMPHEVSFDEQHYVKEVWSLMNFGYAKDWPDDASQQILEGNPNVWQDVADFVVHPMLAKWIIAIGVKLFGLNPFGWRFMCAVFGTLLVGAVMRMARRLSRSTLIGAMAGLFIACDGLAFVLSRLAILDIFQAAFAVVGTALVLRDRDWFREKLAAYLEKNALLNLGGKFGPAVLWRPYRLLAGVAFGLSCGCKWNTIYLVAVMGIMSVVSDWRSRRSAGARGAAWRSLISDTPLAFFYLVLVGLGTYIATWASWFATDGGWARQWGAEHPDDPVVRLLGNALGSLWHYHVEIWDFHVGEFMQNATHPYDAHPAGWLVLARTIGISATNGIQPGVDGCNADPGETCVRVVTGLGTPFLWWFAAIALVAGLLFWILGRDWRFAYPVAALAATWIGWFPNADRPVFLFYAIMIIPFSATVLALCLGKILGPPGKSERRLNGALIVGICVLFIVCDFWFMYPVYSDQLMLRTSWQLRMWFRGWV